MSYVNSTNSTDSAIFVTLDGVHFGKNCWISHEQITGKTTDQLNKLVTPQVAGYVQWVKAVMDKQFTESRQNETKIVLCGYHG